MAGFVGQNNQSGINHLNGDGLGYFVFSLPPGMATGDLVMLYVLEGSAGGALYAIEEGDTHLNVGIASNYPPWLGGDSIYYFYLTAGYASEVTLWSSAGSPWSVGAVAFNDYEFTPDIVRDYVGGGFYDSSTSPKTLTISPTSSAYNVFAAFAQPQGTAAFSSGQVFGNATLATDWGRTPANGVPAGALAYNLGVAGDTTDTLTCAPTGGFHGFNFTLMRLPLTPVNRTTAGSIDVPETKLDLKVLPNKVYESSLDGWAD